MGTFLTLLSPLAYLWIKHSLKRGVDRWWAAVPALGSAAIAAAWPGLNVFGQDGLVSGVNGLLQILAGFFITSLAVIATFSGTTYKIDDQLEGEAALLDGEPLTRRQFLCHLFAYLALASILVYLVGVVCIAIAPSLHEWHTYFAIKAVLRGIFAAGYAAAMGHVLGTTLIGLIFLSSRMSRVSHRDRFQMVPRMSSSSADEVEKSG